MVVNNLFILSAPRSGLHLFENMVQKQLFVDFKNMDNDEFLINKIKEQGKNLLFTHKSENMLKQETVDFILKNTKPVFLVREPKDVFVSYWLLKTKGKISVKEFLFKPFRGHKDFIEYWKAHINGWMQHNIFTVRYEDVITNYQEQSERISEYTGIKVREAKPLLSECALSRKGIIGDYVNHLDGDFIDEINQRCVKEIKAISK